MNSDAVRKQSDTAKSTVEVVIETRARDLVEGFKVRRALPSRGRRMVGPFIFLNQMGPEILRAGLYQRGSRRIASGTRGQVTYGGRESETVLHPGHPRQHAQGAAESESGALHNRADEAKREDRDRDTRSRGVQLSNHGGAAALPRR